MPTIPLFFALLDFAPTFCLFLILLPTFLQRRRACGLHHVWYHTLVSSSFFESSCWLLAWLLALGKLIDWLINWLARREREWEIRGSRRANLVVRLITTVVTILLLTFHIVCLTFFSSTCARRFQSTTPSFIAKRQEGYSFSKAWLSDPSCYPVITALGFACAMCAGVGITCLMNSPDVRISQEKKHSIVRSWGLP